MQFTYYGHACFAVEISGKKILFDPFITGNELAKDIDVNAIQADYILVSHGHSDHVGDLISIAKRTGAMVVGAFEVMEWCGKQGVNNTHPMNFGGKKAFEWGTVKYVPAWHSSVLPDFYYSGDTSLMMDMQLIPRYAKLDFAVLSVGDNFTMGVEDAIVAAEFIQCKKIIGVHFDTFGYIRIDHDASRKQFEDAGLELTLPDIGATIDV